MVDGLCNRNKRTQHGKSALAVAILTAIKFTLSEAKSIIVSYVNRDPCLKLNTTMLNIWQAHHSLFIMESNMKSILCSFSDSLS